MRIFALRRRCSGQTNFSVVATLFQITFFVAFHDAVWIPAHLFPTSLIKVWSVVVCAQRGLTVYAGSRHGRVGVTTTGKVWITDDATRQIAHVRLTGATYPHPGVDAKSAC